MHVCGVQGHTDFGLWCVKVQAGGLAVCSVCKCTQLLVQIVVCLHASRWACCVHSARLHSCWFIVFVSASRWSCSVLIVQGCTTVGVWCV